MGRGVGNLILYRSRCRAALAYSGYDLIGQMIASYKFPWLPKIRSRFREVNVVVNPYGASC